jgi:hypothetical protein
VGGARWGALGGGGVVGGDVVIEFGFGLMAVGVGMVMLAAGLGALWMVVQLVRESR